MLWILVLVTVTTYVQLHLVLRYEMSSRVLAGITSAVFNEVKATFSAHRDYIKGNFRYMVKATDYYISPVHGYLQSLIEQADLDAIVESDGNRYAVWFVEILALFLLTSMMGKAMLWLAKI